MTINPLPRIIGLVFLLWGAALTGRAQGPIHYADWRLEWAEEFNTPLDTAALGERWRFCYPWGPALDATIETGYYTGKELHTTGGALNLTMRKLTEPRLYRGRPRRYETGMLFSRHLIDSLRPYNCHPAEGFSYGLFEVRARQPRSAGAFPAFWLFGGVPDEIDVFEATADAFTSNFHLMPNDYWRPSRRLVQDCQCLFYNADPAGNLSQQFHTYGVSWLPDGVIFYYDGIPIRHETRLIPAGCAMAVIVNLAALAWAEAPIDTLAVDYIRVYRLRQPPRMVAALKSGAEYPKSEDFWMPAETQPGRPDQATHQSWQLAPPPRAPQRLALQLTDNYNPPCELALPLPVAGRWAPTWAQTNGLPELRVQIPNPDSVRWIVRDLRGQTVAHGTAAGGGAWLPRWTDLPPGTYGLQLQQGAGSLTQPLTILGRPAGSGPDAAWQQPAPPAAAGQ